MCRLENMPSVISWSIDSNVVERIWRLPQDVLELRLGVANDNVGGGAVNQAKAYDVRSRQKGEEYFVQLVMVDECKRGHDWQI